MRAPLRFATANLLFPRSLDEAWALYRLDTVSYEGLTDTDKLALLSTIASFAYRVNADFSIYRVSRAWSPADYEQRALALLDPRHGDAAGWAAHLAGHRRALSRRAIVRPEVYLAVRLPGHRAAAPGTPRELVATLRRAIGLGDPAAISEARLRELAAAEAAVHARLAEHVACEPATTLDLQWLVRRAFTRGLGEPDLDVHHRPQALVMLKGDQLSYQPLQADLLRLIDCPITVAERDLRIATEHGDSHQALLALGALPSSVTFPGSQAELLFAPLEQLDFPVDAVFNARWIANDRATALVRRKVIDADNIYGEEQHGDHGPSPQAARRPGAARALEDYLTADSRPPLLHATIGLAVGAPDMEELETRVAALRGAYGTVHLHRPFGEQHRLFTEHLPAQGTQVPDYADHLLVEQLGAMVPLATHHVGPHTGAYIGHTLSGSRQPVLYDPTEASRTSRPPATLLAGTLGSGKTIALQLLLYQAFLRGSRIVDIDPKGDHNLDRLPGMSGNVETIELAADPRFRGLLDPLRIAPPGTGEDLAVNFLIEVLPQPLPPEWRTEIRRAVKTVAASGGDQHCGAVISALRGGSAHALAVADALEVYADTGLAQLGFGSEAHAPQLAGQKPVTSLRIRNLPRPLPATPRADLSEDERIGQAVLRLLAAYAMHLMGADRTRHKVLGFDEAWFLLQDATGRRLIEHLNRWGRSENATPILVTHLISDAGELDNLIGTRFMFGFESDSEARAALEQLRLDGDDARLRGRLLAYRKGRCLLRDLDGRVGAVQIELPGEDMLAVLDTTPRP